MPSKANLSLIFDATITPLEDQIRNAKTLVGDFTKSAEQNVAAIRKAFENMSPKGELDFTKDAQASVTRYVATLQSMARAQSEAFETGTAAGALKSAVALDELAAKQRAIATAAAEAKGATEAETRALNLMAQQAEFAANTLARQADGFRLQSEVLTKVESGMARFGTATKATAANTGSLRFGLQDLSYQISDIATGFATGTPAMQIFAQQGGQVAGALGQMSGGAKGFLGFIGGPWGIAITAGATVLGALIMKMDLFTNEAIANAKALDSLKAADDGVSSAQSVLGKMFDLTTGKLQQQNAIIRANIELMIAKMRADAGAGLAEAKTASRSAGQESYSAIAKSLFTVKSGPAGPGRPEVADTRAKVLLDNVIAGKVGLDVAVKSAMGWDFSGVNINKKDYINALLRAGESRVQMDTADKAEASLTSGKLNPVFMNPGKGGGRTRTPRAPVDHSAQYADQVEAAMDAAEQERIAIARQGVTDAQLLAALDKQAVDAALEKKLVGNRKLKADHTALDAAETANAEARKAVIDQKLITDLRDRELGKAQEALQAQSQILEIQARLAPTLEERKALAMKALDNERKDALLQVERDRLAGRLSFKEAYNKTSGVNALYDVRETDAKNQFLDPLEAYHKRLVEAAGDMKTALQGVKADGLQSLEDGLVGVISGTESVASAFKRMAASILADLARIAIQKAILSVFGLKDGGLVPVQKRAGGGMIFGPGGPRDDAVPAMLSAGEFVMTAAATSRYLPTLMAMNSGHLPRFADGGAVLRASYPRIPTAAELGGRGGTVVMAPIQFDLRGAVMTTDLLQQMQRISAAHAQAAVLGGAQLARSELLDENMQRIPL